MRNLAPRPVARPSLPGAGLRGATGQQFEDRLEVRRIELAIPVDVHRVAGRGRHHPAAEFGHVRRGHLAVARQVGTPEPHRSRDHTERMIRLFGGEVNVDGLTVSIAGPQSLRGTHIYVPGDISSAAFFLVAGAIVPNSEITLKNVGLNPTRTGIIDVLERMGADITIDHIRNEETEPIGDITIRTSTLHAIEIGGDIIPRLIDEIPIIALLATQAEGTTIIKDASELKVKETNRIDTVVAELKKFGADIEATDDGMIIRGKTALYADGIVVDSHGDHRIGMMLAIAACCAKGTARLERPEAVAVSYPAFFADLRSLL